MDQLNHQDYYSARAASSRILAQQATDAAIAAIHTEFAIRYDLLAAQSERKSEGMMRLVQAA